MLSDALDGTTVVEVTSTAAGRYSGRVLAELGADVTRLAEDPGADDRSSWLDAGKRTAELKPRHDDEQIARLRSADVLIHDQLPEDLERYGIDLDALRDSHAGLIILAVTPFGLTGPNRNWRTHQLIDLHAGGEGWGLVQELAADGSDLPARPPVKTGGDATELYCGLMGATGVLAALHRRHLTGEGNSIDMSKQEASMWPARVELSGFPNAGIQDRRRTRERIPGGVLKTLDGWVEIMPFEDRMWAGLVRAMGNPAWADDERYRDRMARLARANEINPLLEAWTIERTSAEVYEVVQEHGCPAYEVMSVDKLAASPHYAARGFFVTVDTGIPGLRRIPSTPFTGDKPTYRTDTKKGSKPARRASQRQAAKGFLDGIRVLDLTFNRAGPSCTAALAALGAEVLRVESRMRIDSNRMRRSVAGKVVDGDPEDDLETRWSFGSINMGKKSILLNLQAEGMNDILRRLVEQSDVVVESFTPGTIERYGFGFETLRQWKSDVVLVSVNGFGRGGTQDGYRAYADIFGAAGGLQFLTGYPDRPPMQFVGRLDSVVGSFAIVGTLAALLHRVATGHGQHVEVSAAEAVTTLLGTPMIDYLVDGTIAQRTGNRTPDMAPHNCYRCLGGDDWIAIAVGNPDEWRALCNAMGQPELAHDSRFATLEARKANEEELDGVLEVWTARHGAYELAARLQEAGCPAAPSMRPDQLFTDAHLQERAAWVSYEHPVQGTRHDLRLPWLFANGACSYGPAPMFGQHTAEVLGGLLGMSDAEMQTLMDARVIF